MKHFRNEIVWKRCNPQNDAVMYGKLHDLVFVYVVSSDFVFNHCYVPYSQEYVKSAYRYTDDNGRLFSTVPLISGNLQHKGYRHEYEWKGIKAQWRYPVDKMKEYENEGRLHYNPQGMPRFKMYLDDMPGALLQDIWLDVTAEGRQQYPTQKPLKLLERIIRASSNQGDVVLDPFCGSGTTLVAAKTLGRKYIGIDQNPEAVRISENRLNPPQQELFTA